MDIQQFETEWGGKTLSIEIGRVAWQAHGSVLVRYGDTVVLGTATMSDPRPGMNFFPLIVEYEEKLYASGKIKSSRFMKREGRPTDEAILTARMIDRSIRPLFDFRVRNDTQVWTTVLSADLENDSDVIAMIAGSCALAMSQIPWNGPIAGIRIGRIDGEWVINPSFTAREKSELDLIVAGTPDRVIMVEADGKEVPEEVVVDGINFAQKHLNKPIELIQKVVSKVGKQKLAIEDLLEKNDEEKQAKIDALLPEVKDWVMPKIQEALFSGPLVSKTERKGAIAAIKDELRTHLEEKETDDELIPELVRQIRDWAEEEVTRAIIEDDKRVDGRSLTEIRPLKIEVGVLPRTHGSALFSRGETQVLSIVTLGSPGDEQTIDSMDFEGKKRYMHHYTFPPFSVGETKPNRGPGRRDIGHGALAEKALIPVVPQDKEQFPYTLRVVSEVLTSNGSSSQASVCGSSLALMDAGVPTRAQIAGVAMGLASLPDMSQWKVLTDIQDLEDGAGGMDFKIAGSQKGITSIQMDTKTTGLTPDIIKETISQARDARKQILDAMDAVIKEPRAEFSEYAPRITSFTINPELIRNVIGPGGKQINEIIDATGVQIDIEDDGLVMITSKDAEAAEKATKWIKDLTREVKVGEIFTGKVNRIMDFGAFVEILPGQDGLVHISELADEHVGRVEDVAKIGDEVTVKVIEIDSMGRINLSIRQAKNPDAPVEVKQKRPPRNNSDRPRRDKPRH